MGSVSVPFWEHVGDLVRWMVEFLQCVRVGVVLGRFWRPGGVEV